MAEKTVLQGVVRDLPLDLLDVAEWNPQMMDDKEFNRLVDELRDTGQIDPIQVVPLDNGRYRIIGGHQRTMAAKVLGWDQISCVVLSDKKWQNEDLQKFMTVRLNVLKGKINPEKFAALYHQMAEKYGNDAVGSLMGFTDEDAMNRLVGSVRKGLQDAGLPEKQIKRFDKATEKMKTVDDLSLILNRMFTDFGDTLGCNFMVFVFGGKKHLYIKTDRALFTAAKTLADWCAVKKTDINKPLTELIRGYVEDHRLSQELSKMEKNAFGEYEDSEEAKEGDGSTPQA